MQKSVFKITDEREGLTSAFPNPDNLPMIDGCNYFTGQLPPGDERSGSWTADAGEWPMLWRSLLGTEPPGPLPEGALGYMFVCGGHPESHVTTALSRAARRTDRMYLEWTVTYSAKAQEEERRVSYAVVVLPETEYYSARMVYVDAVAIEEKRHAACVEKAERLKAKAKKIHVPS